MPVMSYFPVLGASMKSFSNDWGAPRSGGRGHEGTDIFAPSGTPLIAVTGGTITAAGNDGGKGGLRVWINGTFYYAHLSKLGPGIKAGVRVKAGQVIGYVGNSGNAASTPPHLHFGYDPSGSHSANGWANPFPFLRKLVNGGKVVMGKGGTPIDESPKSARQQKEDVFLEPPVLPQMGEPVLPTTPPGPEELMVTPEPPGSVSIGYTPRRRADAWDLISQVPNASPETLAYAKLIAKAASADS